MTELQLHASQSYTITIGSNILAQLKTLIPADISANTICVVSDENVWHLHGNRILEILHSGQRNVIKFLIPAGESSKNFQNYMDLLNFLCDNRITRKDCIIAFGGGVVGDLAGFAAATYLRGIAYIQIPTTLLAMVDSSVGGKTGIDLPGGKNMVGAFYQPRAVLCDIDILDTLPASIFRQGCAEVMKYGILYDPMLFAHLETHGLNFDREWVIAQCIQWKRKAVEEDEFDRGSRMMLNLGHTIGHAIEKCSNYTISHGEAVAIGMAMVSRSAKCPDMNRIISLIEAFGLPSGTDFSAETLVEAALSDKKRSADAISMIIPKAIGDCCVVSTPTKELQAFIEEGL